MNFEPLKITARLGSPFHGDPTAPIDGILGYLSHVREFGLQVSNDPGKSPEFHRELLPLAIVDAASEDWFFAASFALWPDQVARQRDHWNKRLDVLAAEQYTDGNSVSLAKGQYKPYHVGIQLQHARTMEWYVVGDRAQIVSLLDDAPSIGKKRAQGFGEVRRWDVSPVAEDWSCVNASGAPMRAIPVAWWKSHRGTKNMPPVVNRTIRPNYWDIKNYRLCVMP